MRRQGTVDNKRNYKPKVTKGNVTNKDFSKAQEYAQKAKEKHLREQQQKRSKKK